MHRLDAVLKGSAPAEPGIVLKPPTEAQEVVADYGRLGLTLRRHPMALLRARFDQEQVVRSDQLRTLKNGSMIDVAGIVTHRQRPGTATGVVFITLEDETGVHNLIVWAKVFEAQRDAVLGARLMKVRGQLQSEKGVLSILCCRIEDYSKWLGQLQTASRDFH